MKKLIYLIKKTFYYTKINKKTYKIKDKIIFKKFLEHPYSKELISEGTIIDINKNILKIYLADGIIDLGDNGEAEQCSAWIKEFSKSDLENLIK